MKNPLRKRYLRELKSDFGKYIAVALFLIMLAGLVSGYLVAAESIENTFYEGWEKYNIEDGHITFSALPPQEVLDEIEDRADLTFYDLDYIEEDIDSDGTTLRIFRDRTEIDTECLMEGQMPAAADEIAIDRNFANNNGLAVGDTVRLNGKEVRITGIVALVDYNCLYENNSDMIFNAKIFGVGVMTADGFDALHSDHLFYSYAWKYDTAPADESEENSRSEDLLDVLEDVITEYDEAQVQSEVDALYAEANGLAQELTDEFDTVSETVEEKITAASEAAAEKAVAGLSDEEKLTLYQQGAGPEEYFAAAAEAQGCTVEDLVAEELGTTAQALEAFEDAAEDLEAETDTLSVSEEAPKISLDEDESYENDMDLSLEPLRDLVEKLNATGLYDVSKLTDLLDRLEGLSHYQFDESSLLQIDNYIPKYQNKSITYCMDDMAGDRPMFILFDYIVIVILAFVFAVTVSSTIQKEAGVIGTLRASGYTRKELILHYLFLPVVVTVIASAIGNILGYTVFLDLMKSVFYNSFSLATYEPAFSAEALIYTTVIPLVLMFVINLLVLVRRLRISPIRFLRRDLSVKKNRRAVRLNRKLPFLTRFRLRILFQNISAYIILALGIFFGGVIAIFGFMFGPLLNDYADLIVSEKICDYQYVLTEQAETETAGVEKYCLTSLDSTFEGFLTDEISIYGIEPDSAYVTADIPAGEVLVSEGILAKFGLAPGDDLTLKDPYDDAKTYAFRIAGSYPYSASLAVFMNVEEYRDMFGEADDYFTGYFSSCEITDLDAKDIASVITESDLTKVSDQMMNSMGEFMSLFKYFGAIMLALLMYLMTKQVIEKNAQSIAMTKILGFRDREIGRLYLVMTGIVVLVSLLLTMPLADLILRWAFQSYLYKEVSGYIPYIVSSTCYLYTFLIGIVCFLAVAAFMFRKIGRIEKSEALKNVE